MEPPERIAEPTVAHRAPVAELLAATGVFSSEEIGVALELFDSGVQPVTHGGAERPRDYELLGAFAEDGSIVGYACFGPTPGTVSTYDLYWIAVHPRHHARGTGSRLLADVERRLAARGARLLVVETSSRSEYAPTRGFYGRRGYAETARVREFYAPGDDRIIFTKRFLSPTGQGATSP